MTTRRAAIVAPMRTPVGTFGGSLAVKYGITRDEADAYTARSHQRAAWNRSASWPGGRRRAVTRPPWASGPFRP